MSHHRDTDQILGFTFGEVLPENSCILVDMYVRTIRGQSEMEGRRGGLVFHQAVLQEILDAKDRILEAMAELGANQDILPSSRLPVPAWDQGPTLKSTGGDLFLCDSFGITEVVPESGAVAAVIEITQLVKGAETYEGEYLLPHQVLVSLLDTIPKVLSKIEQRSSSTGRAH